MGERQRAGIGEGGGAPGDERQREARQILDRIDREAASGSNGIIMRGMERTARHLSAQDTNKDDHIELWATRIGRMLGLLIVLAIIGWLIYFLMNS